MSEAIKLSLANLPDMSARGFLFQRDGESAEGLLVNCGGEYFAYLNHCPHTGVNLNWQEDQFFDLDHKFIQCSMHGALFDPRDGRCIWGPCRDKYLISLRLKLCGDYVQIEV